MLQEQEGAGRAAQAAETRPRGEQRGRHGGQQAQVSNAEHKVCSVSVHFVLVRATSSKMDNCTSVIIIKALLTGGLKNGQCNTIAVSK